MIPSLKGSEGMVGVYTPKRNRFWDTLTSDKYFRWTLLIPLFLVLLLFLFYPLFYCLYYSFHTHTLLKPAEFIGLANFYHLLNDEVFWSALGRTAIILSLSIAVELLLGLGIALLLNRGLRGESIFRSLCLLPLMIMPLAMSMIWNFILQYDFGAANQILVALGGSKISWFAPGHALFTLCFMNIWQWFPFSVFVLLAGLKSLPKEAFEAAKVDGASAWTVFRKITLPMLSPLIVIIVLLRTMWLIRFFDPLYGTTRGGANTEVLDWMMYRTTFVFFDIGEGSALALISLFLTVIVCAILFRQLMKALGVIK
jgi:multiple sugar transport system permease protein